MASITQLFFQKNVEEMKQLEEKTRHEIELKKEELRQMVGERYRDLIEAADTINEMKTCSTNVRDSIKDVRQFCSSNSLAKQRKALSIKKQKDSKDSSRYMEVAAEAKVLMEMPEKIWSYVESGHMISASLLYLQSLQVLKNLSLDGSTSYSPVLLWFPMLGQQAQAVGNLRAAILKESHSLFLDHLLPTEKLAEALCAIVVLENSKVSEALRILLKARLSVLSDTLSSDITTRRTSKNIGAKAQICDGAGIMKQTVVQVHELFCSGNGGLVAELLTKHCLCSPQDMATIFLGKQDSTKLWTKHLPSDTTRSQINVDSNSVVISSEVVQSCCLAWLSESEEVMKDGVEKLLKFTTTAKDLASIRSSLLEVLAESVPDEKLSEDVDKWTGLELESGPTQPNMWDVQCKVVFNREVHLWKEVLQALFVEKINAIIKDTFEKLFNQSKEVLAQCCDLHSSLDICSYVWKEHDNDICPDMAWNPWQTRKHNDLASQSGLSLKAVTITPNIQFVCKGINKTMSEFLSDLKYYTSGIAAGHTSLNPQHGQSKTQSAKETESKNIIENLKISCFSFLRTLISHTQHLREEIQQNVSNLQIAQHTLDQTLYLSLVCRNFFELCHSFKQCCCPQDTNHQMALRRQLSESMSKKVDVSKNADFVAWNTVVNSMSEESRKFMSIWCTVVLDNALKVYKSSLLSSAGNGNLLRCVALWDNIAVEEESETGDKVTSQIKIPASATAFTQEYLYQICSEVNRVGGYSASRHTLQYLSQGCLNGVYRAFSEARRKLSSGDANLHGQSRKSGETATPTQSWALQCLFDLRYCNILLHHPSASSFNEDFSKDESGDDEDEEKSLYTFTELVDWLEGYIDPFDLDVFSPYLTRNIQRHVTRTCVLLGILASPDRMNSAAQKFSTSSKDSHNVFPLSSECARFPYLPVAGRSSSTRSVQRMSSLSRQLPLASALRELTRSSVDEDEKQQNLTSSFYSKLGALSSSWLSMSSSYSED